MELGEAPDPVPVEVLPDEGATSLGLVGAELDDGVASFSAAGTLEATLLAVEAPIAAAEVAVLYEAALWDPAGAGAEPPLTALAAPQLDGGWMVAG